MKEFFYGLLLLLFIVFVSSIHAGTTVICIGGTSTVCTESYNINSNLTDDMASSVGRYDSREYVGVAFTTGSEICICEFSLQINSVHGTVGGGDNNHAGDFYAQIFSRDGNNDIDALLGTSAAIDGDDITAAGTSTTWTFSPCVTVSSGDFAIVITPDTDSNVAVTDIPEVDENNYFKIDGDDERNYDAVQEGHAEFTWDASIPFVDHITFDPEDDHFATYSTE